MNEPRGVFDSTKHVRRKVLVAPEELAQLRAEAEKGRRDSERLQKLFWENLDLRIQIEKLQQAIAAIASDYRLTPLCWDAEHRDTVSEALGTARDSARGGANNG